METTVRRLAKKVSRCVLIGIAFAWMPSAIASAQMPPWDLLRQEALARQNYERQQWAQWRQQEQTRQMSERQQWLQWRQEEKIRQMYQR